MTASWAWRFVPTNRIVLALRGEVLDELQRILEQVRRLLQVEDVDAVALAEDELLHLRVPAAGLVAEMDAGLHGRGLRADTAAKGDAAHRPLGRIRGECGMVLSPGDQGVHEIVGQGVRHRGAAVGQDDHHRGEPSGRDELVGGHRDADVAPLGLVGTPPWRR